MICKSYKNLPAIRTKYKNKTLVFCSGTFDVTHAGHVLFFEDCKKYGDILVVGVGGDVMIKLNKGKDRPILNQHVRLKMVDTLKPVDYCFLDESAPKDHPSYVVESAFKILKPDVYVINEDAFDIPYRKSMVEKYGVKMVILPRTCPPEFDGISTTKIIAKIKNSS